MAAGTVETFFPSQSVELTQEVVPESAGCEAGCGCAQSVASISVPSPWYKQIGKAIHYAITDLLKDLAPYLLLGFILAGLVGAYLDSNSLTLSETVRSGWIGYLGAVLVGLPMYICASSSTPLAAVLLAAGFSPGAILVFLLTGPATNIASLVVVKRIIGFASTVRYLIVIVVVAVLGGLATDYVYQLLNYAPNYQAGTHGDHAGWLAFVSALLLGCFILYYALQNLWKRLTSFLLKR
jgi:hypothetical protein